MATVRVAILDPTGQRKTRVKVPDDVETQRLVPALVTRTELPQVGPNGRPISYRLAHTRSGREVIELNPAQTLADAGVEDDDTLHLYAVMEAGPKTEVQSILDQPSPSDLESIYALLEDLGSQIQISTAVEEIKNEILSKLLSEVDYLKETNQKLLKVTEQLQNELDRLRNIISPGSIVEGTDALEEERKHQLALRKELLKRLHALELEQAKKGIDTPPQVEIQISDIRERIAEVDARIKIITYDMGRPKSGSF